MTDFAAPTELASYLQRDLDLSTAELVLAGATEFVRDYCRWNITTQTVTWTLDGSGTTIQNLPTLHLTAVTSVTVDGVALVADEDYTWSATGQLYRYAGWPAAFRNVVAAVTHGYATVPSAVRLATLALAAREYSNPERLERAAVGTVSRQFAPTYLETHLLHSYRIP